MLARGLRTVWIAAAMAAAGRLFADLPQVDPLREFEVNALEVAAGYRIDVYTDEVVTLDEAIRYAVENPTAVNRFGKREILVSTDLYNAHPAGVTLKVNAQANGTISCETTNGIWVVGNGTTPLAIESSSESGQGSASLPLFKFGNGLDSRDAQCGFRYVTLRAPRQAPFMQIVTGNVACVGCRVESQETPAVEILPPDDCSADFIGENTTFTRDTANATAHLKFNGQAYIVLSGCYVSGCTGAPFYLDSTESAEYSIGLFQSTVVGVGSMLAANDASVATARVFGRVTGCAFLDCSGILPLQDQVDPMTEHDLVTNSAAVCELPFERTAAAFGVTQMGYAVKRFGALDGAGQLVDAYTEEGYRTKDIFGVTIKGAASDAFQVAIGCCEPNYEVPSLKVSFNYTSVDHDDGTVSLGDALEYAASGNAPAAEDGKLHVVLTNDADWVYSTDILTVTAGSDGLPPIVLSSTRAGICRCSYYVVLETDCDLVISNLTFSDAGDYSNPVIVSHGRLLVEDCRFNNTGQLYADGGLAVVVRSTFDGNASALNLQATNVVVAESTIIETGNNQSRIASEEGALVLGNTFANVAPVFASDNDLYVGNILGSSHLATGASTEVQSVNPGGNCTQCYYEANKPGVFCGTGSFLWHDDAWTNVAYSASRYSTKTAAFGDVSLATNILDRDITGFTIGRHNSCGSYACRPDDCALVVDSATDDDNVTDESDYNDVDGKITLRECLLRALADTNLVNAAGKREIGFADSLLPSDGSPLNIVFDRQIRISEEELNPTALVVSGRVDRLTRFTKSTKWRFMQIDGAANLYFKDISFENFNMNRVDDYIGGVFYASGSSQGSLILENCRISGCVAREGGVFGLDPESALHLRFVDCSLIDNGSAEFGDVAWANTSELPADGVAGVIFVHSTIHGVDSCFSPYYWYFKHRTFEMFNCTHVQEKDVELSGYNFNTYSCSLDKAGLSTDPVTNYVRAIPHIVYPPLRYGELDGAGGQVYHNEDWSVVSTSPAEGLVRKTTDEVGNPIPDPSDTQYQLSAGSICPLWEKPSLTAVGNYTSPDPSDGTVSLGDALDYAASGYAPVSDDGKIHVVLCAGVVSVQATNTLTVTAGCTNLAPITLSASRGAIYRATADPVLVSDCDLMISNVHFTASYNSRFANPAVVSRGRLQVADCLFDDCGTLSAGGSLAVVRNSTFDGAQAAMQLTATNVVLAESTVIERDNAPSRIASEKGALVLGNTFANVAPTLGSALDLDIGNIHGAAELATGADASKKSVNPSGIFHHAYFEAYNPGVFCGTGSFLWHDDAWTNVAYSVSRRSTKTAAFGEAALATVLLDVDVTATPIAAQRNSCGSFACRPDACTLVVDCATEDANALDDRDFDDLDGKITFREAVMRAEADATLTNAAGTRVITFADSLLPSGDSPLTFELDRQLLISGTGLSTAPLTISGRVDRLTRFTRSGSVDDCRFMRINGAAKLTFKDLSFERFKARQEPTVDGSVLHLGAASSGLVVFENCRVLDCIANFGTVFEMENDSQLHLRFVDCSLWNNFAYEYGNVGRNAGLSATADAYDSVVMLNSTIYCEYISRYVYDWRQTIQTFKLINCTHIQADGIFDQQGVTLYHTAVGTTGLTTPPVTNYVRAVPHVVYYPERGGALDGEGGQVYHSEDWLTVSTSAGTGLVRKATDEVGNPIPDTDANPYLNVAKGAICPYWEKHTLTVTSDAFVQDETDGQITLADAINYATSYPDKLVENGKLSVDFSQFSAAGLSNIVVTGTMTIPSTVYPIVLSGTESGVTLSREDFTAPIFKNQGSLYLNCLNFRNYTDGGEALVANVDDGCLVVERCNFLSSSDSSLPQAIDDSGASLGVVWSSFASLGAAIRSTGERCTVAESTFEDGTASQFAPTAGLVAETTFAGEAPTYNAATSVRGCVLGRDKMLANTEGVREIARIGGTDQYYYVPMSPGSLLASGVYVWHDSTWMNTATSDTRSGAKTAGVGDASSATTIVDSDVRGLTMSAEHNTSGSCSMPSDGLSVKVVTVLFDDDGVRNGDDGYVTLREAVTAANNSSESDYTITFAPELYAGGPVHVLVTNGPLRITRALTIKGPSPELVTLDARQRNRIFEITAPENSAVKLQLMSLVNGKTRQYENNGGAIHAEPSSSDKEPTLTLEDCVFADNEAEYRGGAVFVDKPSTQDLYKMKLYATRCRFERNRTSYWGGAIHSANPAGMYIDRCSFYENVATYSEGGGGAVSFSGSTTVRASTFLCNSCTGAASSGGALCFDSDEAIQAVSCNIINSTFRANRAAYGGSINFASAGTKNAVLNLMNVISTGNTSVNNVESWTADLCLNRDTTKHTYTIVSAYGLVAHLMSTNGTFCATNTLTGRSFIDGKVNTAARYDRIFDPDVAVGSRLITVGATKQYVQPLKYPQYSSQRNVAFYGYDDYETRTSGSSDMTGKAFSSNQMGSYWSQSDSPSLSVTTLSDESDDSDGLVSLRDILTGIASGSSDWLDLSSDRVHYNINLGNVSGTVMMNGGPYEIIGLEDKVITIDGGDNVTICGNFIDRGFIVGAGNSLVLKNLAFSGLLGARAASKMTVGYDGGAVMNLGNLEVSGCSFLQCSAGDAYSNPIGYGGAIVNGGANTNGAVAKISNSTFTSCRAARGGAIYNYANNTVAIEGSTFSGNRTGDGTSVLVPTGGALCNERDGTLSFTGSTFADNTMDIDGMDAPSDYTDLSQPYYTLRAENGTVAVSLNSLAEPTLTEAEIISSLVVDGDYVSIMPGNVKPNLYYALGYQLSYGADFDVGNWVQADSNGTLPWPLVAPKVGDSGYYRIYTSIDPHGDE